MNKKTHTSEEFALGKGEESSLRGHLIYWDGEEFRFRDTDEQTVDTWRERTCGKCNLPNRADGHDACIGRLHGVVNACCGHGSKEEAYVQFPDTLCLRGASAEEFFSRNGVEGGES